MNKPASRSYIKNPKLIQWVQKVSCLLSPLKCIGVMDRPLSGSRRPQLERLKFVG